MQTRLTRYMLIVLMCLLLWTSLLSSLTVLTSRRANSAVENELLLPVTARRLVSRANASLARCRYVAAIADFDQASEIYLRLVQKEARVDYLFGVIDSVTGRGHAHRAVGDLAVAARDYSESDIACDALLTFGDEPGALTSVLAVSLRAATLSSHYGNMPVPSLISIGR